MFSTSPTMLFLYCSTSKTTLASLAPVARSTSANSESRFLTGQLLTGTHFGPPLKFLTQRVVDALQASSAEINSDSRRSKFQLPLNGDTAFSVLDLSDFSPCNSRCSSRIKPATFPGVVAEEISELSQMKPSCEASLMEICSAQTRFFLEERLYAGKTPKKIQTGCENPSSLREELPGIELRAFCARSRNHTSRPTGRDDAVLIGLEPRMFCTRSKNHTSRPTCNDAAICAVL
jgi:hypothetical protein